MKTRVILFLFSILLVTACQKSPTGGGDTTPPKVVETSPDNNASEVSVDADIDVTFNEDIDMDSFSLSVQDSTGNGIESSTKLEKAKVTVTLETSLNFSTKYTVLVTASDVMGNEMEEPYSWEFTTESDDEDVTPPSITSVSPNDGSASVSVHTDIQAEFSENVIDSTLNFEVENTTDNSSVAGGITKEGNTYVFSPDGDLQYGVEYQASVAANDLAGNEMEEAYTWSFETEAEQDNESPYVRDTNPKDGDSDVSVTTTIRVEFNEQVSDEITFALESNSGGSIDGESEVDANIFTFTPNDPLESSTTYEASISAVDLAGNGMDESYSWSFETEFQDNTSPDVVSVSPENNATDVPIDTDVEITFDEDVDSENSQLTLESSSGSSVQGNTSFNGGKISFVPNSSLSYSTTYTAEANVADPSGNESSHSWSFTTADEPDNTPPEVVYTSPEDGELDVSLNSVTIEMSEAIDPTSVSSDNVWVENDEGDHLDYDISVEDNLIKLSIVASEDYHETMKPSSRYFAHVEEVEDLAGNKMQGLYEWDFVNKLWNVSYHQDTKVLGAASDESGVYINGTLEKEGNFTGFFITKFNNSGVIEWVEELPGKSDTGVSDLMPALNKDLGELYFFTEIDKVVHFNRMDLTTRDVYSTSVSEIGRVSNILGDIVIDNDNDLYFLTSGILKKIDRNGNVLDEFDFLNSPASSLTTDGSNLFVATDHDDQSTVAKIDSETLDLIGLLNVEDHDPFPTVASVHAIHNTDKQYIVGSYEDKPMLAVLDESEDNVETVQFGDIYDIISVSNSDIDSEGNVYILLSRSGDYDLVKVSLSGVSWRVEANISVDRKPILLEEKGLVLIPDTFDNNLNLFSISNGGKVN